MPKDVNRCVSPVLCICKSGSPKTQSVIFSLTRQLTYISKDFLGHRIRIFPMANHVRADKMHQFSRKIHCCEIGQSTNRPPCPIFSLTCVKTIYLLEEIRFVYKNPYQYSQSFWLNLQHPILDPVPNLFHPRLYTIAVFWLRPYT